MANSSQIQLSPLVKAPAGGTQGMNVIRASLRRPPPAAALHGSGAGQRHNQVVNKARVDNKPTAKLKRLFRKQLSALYSLLRAFFCIICPPVCVLRNLSSLHICINMCERNSQPSWSTHLWRLKNREKWQRRYSLVKWTGARLNLKGFLLYEIFSFLCLRCVDNALGIAFSRVIYFSEVKVELNKQKGRWTKFIMYDTLALISSLFLIV